MPDVKSKIDLDTGDLKTNLDDFTSRLEDIVDLWGTLKEESTDVLDYQKETFAGIADAAKDTYKEQKTGAEETKKEVLSLGQAYEKMVSDMKRQRGAKGVIAEMLPEKAQFMGVQNSMAKLKGSILSELPFGGLIGLMVLGGRREEEVRAMGAQVGRVFQQTGQAGRREMGLIGNDIRRLGVLLGKGPTGLAGEAASAAAAFAQAGIDIETVVNQKFSEPIKGSRGSIFEASMAIDALFKQASGTAARQMGEMIRDFNLNAKESARVVAAIGLSARDSGTSVAVFSSSVMRSAQALRTQRVDIEEVAEAQLAFQRSLERTMPGVTKQFTAGYAERAIGQVTQGLAGMSVGLSAVLGERITARGGAGAEGAKTGLEAYYALREGFQGRGQQGEEGGMFVESVRELLTLAQENGRTVEEQRFFLERMGFGFEGAKAIIDVGKETAKGTSLQSAISKHQGELNRAFIDRASETSSFQRALLKIQNGIAKVGAGLLAATIGGMQTIIFTMNYMAQGIFGDDAEKRASLRMIDQSVKMSTKGYQMIVGGIGEVFGGAKQGVMAGMGLMGGGETKDWSSILGEERQRAKDIESGEYVREVGGEELREDIKRSELRRVAGAGREEQLRRKEIGVEQVLGKTTLKYEDIPALLEIYRKEEIRSGAGERAVQEAIKGRSITELEGYEKVTPAEVARRISAVERRQVKEAEIDVPGGGRMKVEIVVKALEGPQGVVE